MTRKLDVLLARAWVRCNTVGLARGDRAARIAEIESDLSESDLLLRSCRQPRTFTLPESVGAQGCCQLLIADGAG